MFTVRKMPRFTTAFIGLLLAGSAQAALILQQNGVEVLDTDTNLLWLHDWNVNGEREWQSHKNWAAGLTVGGANAGSWRLPEIDEYLDLWADPDVGGSFARLQVSFTNVLTSFYWSGTESVSAPASSAVLFVSFYGVPFEYSKTSTAYATGVRDAPIPEPTTLALVGAALLGIAASRRRKPACAVVRL